MSAKIIMLIQADLVVGGGTLDNPFRTVRELYELDGTLVFRLDPFLDPPSVVPTGGTVDVSTAHDR